MGEHAVSGLSKHLGRDDPQTLTAMFNLARTYLHLGDISKSHDLLQWVVEKREHFFGRRHLDTLMAKDELGMSFCARKTKRDLGRAEALVEEVLEARKEILGEHHAYTLWSINNLAKVSCERGNPEKAILLLKNIKDTVENTLGRRHVGMSMTRSNLVTAYIQSRNWIEAEKENLKVLEIVPSQHPDAIHAKLRHVQILMNTDRIGEAERCCTEMLDVIARIKILKPDSPATTAIARQLWEIYRMQKHVDDAARIEREYPAILKSEDRSEVQRLPDTSSSKLESPPLNLADDETAPSLGNVSGSHHQSEMLEMPSPEIPTKLEEPPSVTTLTRDHLEFSSSLQRQRRVSRMRTY